MVSHDRAFLDNVVSSTIVYEGNGEWNEYVGGYQDWPRQRAATPVASEKKPVKPVTKTPAPSEAAKTKPAKKLSYKDQRELDMLPAQIEELETKLEKQQQLIGDPGFYQQPQAEVDTQLACFTDLEERLEAAYARWDVLDAMTKE